MLDISYSSVRCLGLGKNKFEGLTTRNLGKSPIEDHSEYIPTEWSYLCWMSIFNSRLLCIKKVLHQHYLFCIYWLVPFTQPCLSWLVKEGVIDMGLCMGKTQISSAKVKITPNSYCY